MLDTHSKPLKKVFQARPSQTQATCQLKNSTTIDSNEHREKEEMNKYMTHEEMVSPDPGSANIINCIDSLLPGSISLV